MVAVSVCTGKPDVREPANTLTVTADEPLGVLPTAPEKPGVRLFVVLPFIGLVNVSAGATVSMLHDLRAGIGSTSPKGLIERTSKACSPSTSAVYLLGLLHTSHGPPSRLHSKLPRPTVDANRKTVVELLLNL